MKKVFGFSDNFNRFSSLAGLGFVFWARNVMSSKMNGNYNVVAWCICINKNSACTRIVELSYSFSLSRWDSISRWLHDRALVFQFIIVVGLSLGQIENANINDCTARKQIFIKCWLTQKFDFIWVSSGIKRYPVGSL